MWVLATLQPTHWHVCGRSLKPRLSKTTHGILRGSTLALVESSHVGTLGCVKTRKGQGGQYQVRTKMKPLIDQNLLIPGPSRKNKLIGRKYVCLSFPTVIRIPSKLASRNRATGFPTPTLDWPGMDMHTLKGLLTPYSKYPASYTSIFVPHIFEPWLSMQ